MDALEFFALIKSGELKGAYLMEGEEEFPKEKALSSLKDTLFKDDNGMNVNVLMNPSSDEFCFAVDSPPWLSEKRLIIVKESDLFEKNADEVKKYQGILNYLTKIPDFSIVIFYVRGKLNKTKAIFKAFDKLKRIVSFDKLKTNQLFSWIKKQFSICDLSCSDEFCEQLIFTAGNELLSLYNEIQKLVAFVNGRNLHLEDIDRVVTKSIEYRVFDLSDAIAKKDKDLAISLSQTMQKDGIAFSVMLAIIQKQLRQLLYVRLSVENGDSIQDISKKLSLTQQVVIKLKGLANKFGFKSLIDGYLLSIDCEKEFKSGLVSEQGALDRLIYRLICEV